MLLIDRLLKVATPPTAATVRAPLKVPPPGFVPMAIVTLLVSAATTLPLGSSIDTCTAGEMMFPAGVSPGWTEKTRPSVKTGGARQGRADVDDRQTRVVRIIVDLVLPDRRHDGGAPIVVREIDRPAAALRVGLRGREVVVLHLAKHLPVEIVVARVGKPVVFDNALACRSEGNLAAERDSLGHERAAAAVVADVQVRVGDGEAAANGEGRAVPHVNRAVEIVLGDVRDRRQGRGNGEGAAENVDRRVGGKTVARQRSRQLRNDVHVAVEEAVAAQGELRRRTVSVGSGRSRRWPRAILRCRRHRPPGTSR